MLVELIKKKKKKREKKGLQKSVQGSASGGIKDGQLITLPTLARGQTPIVEVVGN